jgi:acyl dehydratase
MRDRAGAPIRDSVPPHAEFASVDTIRRFARAYGDDNPLYSDPTYAAASARGGLIAPPLFPIASGIPRPVVSGAEEIDLERVPGVRGQVILRDRWLLRRPIAEGTRLERERRLLEVVAAREGASGEAASGVWDLTERTTYAADGATYAVHDRSRRYRTAPAPAATPAWAAKAAYTPEQIAAIERAYEGETPRGAAPRHGEELAIGAQVGPMVKGPLTITDLVEYRAGVGPGPLGGEALRLAYLNRRRRPELYAPDALGVADITERRHYDEAYAQGLGFPSAYDYSHTRLTWFSHLLTNWLGDGGWLWELTGTTTLGYNFVGDTHWLTGEVTDVRTNGAFGVARLTLSGRNQRDELTCAARAVVLLPARPHSAVPSDLIAALAEGDIPGSDVP